MVRNFFTEAIFAHNYKELFYIFRQNIDIYHILDVIMLQLLREFQRYRELVKRPSLSKELTTERLATNFHQ